MLIEHLPPTGARARALNGHHWTDTEALLAIIADRVAETGAGTIRALGGKARKPKPLPRPGQRRDAVGNRGGRTVAEVKAYLDSLKPPDPPPPVAGLAAAVDRHAALTDQHTRVLSDLHDQM